MSAARWFQGDLIPFGDGAAGLSLWAGARREGGRLYLRFELQGALGDVLIPTPAAAPGRRDELWQHTCFEAFIAAGRTGYHELNFSPSGEWACYRFTNYRAGRQDEYLAAAPVIVGTQPGADAFTLETELDVPGLAEPAAVDVGLTAVIERRDGAKTFWALAHRGATPDFHLRDSFTLRMA